MYEAHSVMYNKAHTFQVGSGLRLVNPVYISYQMAIRWQQNLAATDLDCIDDPKVEDFISH